MGFARSFRRRIFKNRKANAAKKQHRKVLLEALEPRLLLDAAGLDPDPVHPVHRWSPLISSRS